MAEHDDGYSGAAVLAVDGREIPVAVVLDARHEPQDGRLHWFGRLRLEGEVPDPVRAALTSPTSTVTLAAGGRPAPARLGDVDLWGRYRITGIGTPPFLRPAPAPLD